MNIFLIHDSQQRLQEINQIVLRKTNQVFFGIYQEAVGIPVASASVTCEVDYMEEMWPSLLATISFSEHLYPCVVGVRDLAEVQQDASGYRGLQWWLGRQVEMDTKVAKSLRIAVPAWESENPGKVLRCLAVVFRENVMEIEELWNSHSSLRESLGRLRTQPVQVPRPVVPRLVYPKPPLYLPAPSSFQQDVVQAMLEHRYSAYSEIKFAHPRGGWVRWRVPNDQLPDGADEGATMQVIVRKESTSDGADRFELDLSNWTAGKQQSGLIRCVQLPDDLDDEEAMSRYRVALAAQLGED